jgi:hypothetical protein
MMKGVYVEEEGGRVGRWARILEHFMHSFFFVTNNNYSYLWGMM